MDDRTAPPTDPAHDRLLARLDAELAAGGPVTPVDPPAAEAGVTRMLATLLRPPTGAVLVPDGRSVRLDATDTGRVWTLTLGTVAGVDHVALTGYEGPAQVTGALFGSAWELDRWVWGRLGTDALEVEGDPQVIHRLRQVIDRALDGLPCA